MPANTDALIASTGTRFRVFVLPPQVEAEFARVPETIRISLPPAQIEPGPSDDRMFVVDAIAKNHYTQFQKPPYAGPARARLLPGADGHFDHIAVGTPEFLAATMYATVRRTLDIWEAYLGGAIAWQFGLDFARLELIPTVNWNNAQYGYGYLEFGFEKNAAGTADFTKPLCLNFDVLAHEMGHAIISGVVGVPASDSTRTRHYDGFQESCADLVAILASLHFSTVVDHILESTHGNLFTVNELSRIGEFSKSEQARLAFNYERMSTVGLEAHELSQPLTGAWFDIFVAVFQRNLVSAGLIDQQLADLSMGPAGGMPDTVPINARFSQAYAVNQGGFKNCLISARDYLGALLAETWQHLSADYLTYPKVGLAVLAADQRLTQGGNAAAIRSCFGWREITFPPGTFALRQFLAREMPARSVGRRPRRSLSSRPAKSKKARRKSGK